MRQANNQIMRDKKKRRRKTQDVDENEEKRYSNDLEFLNKLAPETVVKLGSAFKNRGRSWVKRDKDEEWKGMWHPSMGTYRPNIDVARANNGDKLLSIQPEPSQVASEHIKDMNKRKITICDRFGQKALSNSIFLVFKEREKEAREKERLIEIKRQQLKQAKAKNSLGQNLKNMILKKLQAREAETKEKVADNNQDKGMLNEKRKQRRELQNKFKDDNLKAEDQIEQQQHEIDMLH